MFNSTTTMTPGVTAPATAGGPTDQPYYILLGIIAVPAAVGLLCLLNRWIKSCCAARPVYVVHQEAPVVTHTHNHYSLLPPPQPAQQHPQGISGSTQTADLPPAIVTGYGSVNA